MSLYSTTNKILSLCREEPNIFEAAEGSIYDYLNGRMDVAYPVMVLTQQQHLQDMSISTDFDTWTFQLFYVDRLTSDKSNRLQVQSTGLQSIRNVLNKLKQETDILSNTYTTFTERFESLCAGAYAEFSMLDLADNACLLTYDTILWHIYYHTTDGKPINISAQPDAWESIMVYNRAIDEREFKYDDGNYHIANGELVFYAPIGNYPENASPNNPNLDAIYLPSTIGSIGNNAFAGCSSLTTIGGSVPARNIVSYANSVFAGTKIGETFSFGKIQYLGDLVFDGVDNFPDNKVHADMTLNEWDAAYKGDWNVGSNAYCVVCLDGDTCDTGYFRFLNQKGSHLSSATTAYTLTWDTDLEMVAYAWYYNGQLASGGTMDATSGEMTITFPANTDSGSTLYCDFVVKDRESGRQLDYTDWYLDKAEGQPDTGGTLYFRFHNEEDALLTSSSTQYYISWSTNYPSIDYGFYDWKGSKIGSGNTSEKSITLDFSANTNSSSTLSYTFIAIDPSTQENIDSLWWYLAPASGSSAPDTGDTSGETTYYINFTSAPQTIGVNRQLVSFAYDTNCDGRVKYELYSGATPQGANSFVRSGRTANMEEMDITFEANTGSANRYYAMAILASNSDDLDNYVATASTSFYQEYYVAPDTGDTGYFPDNRSGYSMEYLTLEIVSAGTLVMSYYLDNPTGAHYSKDGGNTWTEIPSDLSINVNAGDRIHFAGSGAYNTLTFAGSTARFNAEGNVGSLNARVNCYMFNSTKIVSAENLILGSLLSAKQYYRMFLNCTLLVKAPELPYTALTRGCYEEMFMGCTSLVNTPALPATTLEEGCYEGMFWNCSSIVSAPALPAETLASECYYSMFHNCTSLVNAPELPVTALRNLCYSHMFYGCTSLVNAPALPATALKPGCYFAMFENCTSLVNAPALPATTLVSNCYADMFLQCRKLAYIKCLATDISATDCVDRWVYLAGNNSGTFVKAASMNDWTTGTSGIPAGWTVVDAT